MLQGGHHVAQKSNITGRPRRSVKEISSPFSLVRRNSGAKDRPSDSTGGGACPDPQPEQSNMKMANVFLIFKSAASQYPRSAIDFLTVVIPAKEAVSQFVFPA